MPTRDNPHRYNDDVHYRLYWWDRKSEPTTICVQGFDYPHYNEEHLLTDEAFADEPAAEAALKDLIEARAAELAQRRAEGTLHVVIDPFERWVLAQMAQVTTAFGGHEAADPEPESTVITVTTRVLFDTGRWMQYCELTGMNDWARAEGRLGDEEMLPLTASQAQALGFWPG